jgi:hypothetical protein
MGKTKFRHSSTPMLQHSNKSAELASYVNNQTILDLERIIMNTILSPHPSLAS